MTKMRIDGGATDRALIAKALEEKPDMSVSEFSEWKKKREFDCSGCAVICCLNTPLLKTINAVDADKASLIIDGLYVAIVSIQKTCDGDIIRVMIEF